MLPVLESVCVPSQKTWNDPFSSSSRTNTGVDQSDRCQHRPRTQNSADEAELPRQRGIIGPQVADCCE
jgi:hypothetical protein